MAAELRLIPGFEGQTDFIPLIHPKCEKEMAEIAKESGRIKKFRSDFKARLDFLIANKERCTLHREWFEALKYSETGMHGMRLASINNMRVLFIIQNNESWFLCAFKKLESDGETKSYRKYIPVAEARLSEVLEEV